MKDEVMKFITGFIIVVMFAYIGWRLHAVFYPNDVCESVDCHTIKEQNQRYLNLISAIHKLEKERAK